MGQLIQLLGGNYKIRAYPGLTGNYHMLRVEGYIKNISWEYEKLHFKESKYKKKDPK